MGDSRKWAKRLAAYDLKNRRVPETVGGFPKWFIDKGNSDTQINKNEEAAIVAAAKRKEQWAIDLLVESNYRFMLAASRNFVPSYGQSRSDIFQDGVIGVIEAIDKYDPTLGVKFMSFAVWWFMASIRNGGMKKAYLVRLPIRLYKEKGIQDEQLQELEEHPVTDPGFEQFEVNEYLDECLNHCSGEDRQAFELYYKYGYTLEDVGRVQGGVTRERIRQRLRAAEDQIKKRLDLLEKLGRDPEEIRERKIFEAWKKKLAGHVSNFD